MTYALGLLAYAVLVMIGFCVGARRELLAGLQLRAETAEREQSLRIAQAREQERTRIAREMHDVLAHRISFVDVYAGALAYRDALTRDETRVTATLIAAATDGVLTLRRDEALGHLVHLTERERDAAVVIGHGQANAEIAAELFMSVATVKPHVTRLFAKLAVENPCRSRCASTTPAWSESFSG